MSEFVRAGRVSQSIAMVATLGVADHIKQGPRAAVELAARVGADAGALSRLLRLLADVGVFTELEGRSFALASLGELPCSGHEASMRGHAMLREAPFVRKAWTDLLGAARTGNSAIGLAQGKSLFDYLSEQPTTPPCSTRRMAGTSRQLIAAILDAYDSHCSAPWSTSTGATARSWRDLTRVDAARPGRAGRCTRPWCAAVRLSRAAGPKAAHDLI